MRRCATTFVLPTYLATNGLTIVASSIAYRSATKSPAKPRNCCSNILRYIQCPCSIYFRPSCTITVRNMSIQIAYQGELTRPLQLFDRTNHRYRSWLWWWCNTCCTGIWGILDATCHSSCGYCWEVSYSCTFFPRGWWANFPLLVIQRRNRSPPATPTESRSPLAHNSWEGSREDDKGEVLLCRYKSSKGREGVARARWRVPSSRRQYCSSTCIQFSNIRLILTDDNMASLGQNDSVHQKFYSILSWLVRNTPEYTKLLSMLSTE